MKRIHLRDLDPVTITMCALLIGATLSVIGWPLLVLVLLCAAFLSMHYDEEITDEHWTGEPDYRIVVKLLLAFWLTFSATVGLGTGYFIGAVLFGLKAGNIPLIPLAVSPVWGYVCYLSIQVTMRARVQYYGTPKHDVEAFKVLSSTLDIRKDRKPIEHKTYPIGDKIEKLGQHHGTPLLKGKGKVLVTYWPFSWLYVLLLVLRSIFINRHK